MSGLLQAALEFVREGDVLVVTKLDRLARSVADLMELIQTLDRKSVGLRVLSLGMDTHSKHPANTVCSDRLNCV